MTTMSDSIRDDATSLNIALLDGLYHPPRRPLSTAWGMVQANPAAANMLLKHIESDPALACNRLAGRAQDVLRSMLARLEARRVLDEIESEDEGNSADAASITTPKNPAPRALNGTTPKNSPDESGSVGL